MTLFYVIALLIAFYFLMVAEFFLPTGGVLGTGAVALLVAAVVIAFSHSMVAGISVVVFVLLTAPFVLFGMVRIWPHTAIGRRMLNLRPGEATVDPPKRTTSQGIPIEDLVGRIGTAKTDLLPSGLVVIEGERMDGVSTGMPIDAGTTLVVTSVDGGRVHVRAATDEESSGQEQPPPQSPASLEKSLESFDIE
jgi:membrane-bound ClpP family serine protease